MKKLFHTRMGNLKWCFVCQLYKEISEFGLARTTSDGHVNVCRACRGNYQKAYQAEYYLKHREELLPKHRRSAQLSWRMRKGGLNGRINNNSRSC